MIFSPFALAQNYGSSAPAGGSSFQADLPRSLPTASQAPGYTPNFPAQPVSLVQPSEPELAEPFLTEQPVQPMAARPPRGTRPGVFQSVNLNVTRLPVLDDQPGITELTLATTLGFPFPSRESPLLITPGIGTHFLSGATTPDLPEQLYSTYLQFRWLKRFNERWGLDLAVSPGWYSDWQTSDDEALRITGRAIASYTWSPALRLLFGVVYLDRNDVSVLPAAGLMWNPSEDHKLELLFPRPRYAHRIAHSADVDHWLYLAGEFGGGTWAIERADGTPDTLNMRDFRLIGGYERQDWCGITSRLEVGYVFGREFEFDSDGATIEPDGTILLRATARY